MVPPVFETQRLSVRRWHDDDLPQVKALYSDPDVARFIEDGQPISRDEAVAWMSVTQSNYDKRGYGMFAIEERRTGKLIGFGGLVHPGGQPDGEVKYAFWPTVWAQGFATEFVQGALGFAWVRLGLERVVATVHPDNQASLRVLKKCGFAEFETRAEADGSFTAVLEAIAPTRVS